MVEASHRSPAKVEFIETEARWPRLPATIADHGTPHTGRARRPPRDQHSDNLQRHRDVRCPPAQRRLHGLNDHLPFSRAWPGYRLCCHSEDQRGRTARRRDAACGSLGRVRSYTEALAGRNRGPRVPESVGSFWGEVNAGVYKALGAVGTVTNGGVRDLPEVRPTGFQFFSSCVLVSHAYVHVVEYGGPVAVGGLTVRPGDLLHGDEHGVTSIPLEIARDIPQASQAIEMAERRLIDYARSPACTPERLADMYGRVD
ncbi:MAG: RraA family protein [Chloroflexi bacterium]|nr:MAG: RraA family protein [Chloroflexota bacterium]